jgi:hypothetical protein
MENLIPLDFDVVFKTAQKSMFQKTKKLIVI